MSKNLSSKSLSVAVIGLGIMGSAMAGHGAAGGLCVYGVDVAAPARRAMAKSLFHVSADVRAAWSHCDVWVTSLPSRAALDAVVEQCETCHQTMPRGPQLKPLVIAETSTLTHADKLEVRARLRPLGIVLLDCPLSGTGAQARHKDLAVYASGERKHIRRIKPFFSHCARAVYDVGGFGQGTRMKLVANLLVALHNVATAEALLFGQRMGLDALQMVDVISDGAGGSRMLQVRGPVMAQRHWEQAAMKVEVWQKDMQIIQAALQEAQVAAPLFCASIPLYLAAMAQGHGAHDTAAVYAVLERMAGAQP